MAVTFGSQMVSEILIEWLSSLSVGQRSCESPEKGIGGSDTKRLPISRIFSFENHFFSRSSRPIVPGVNQFNHHTPLHPGPPKKDTNFRISADSAQNIDQGGKRYVSTIYYSPIFNIGRVFQRFGHCNLVSQTSPRVKIRRT